ncbi:hypothetical protein A9K58_16305 [Stenotrophomonas maltophilia]|uniref:Lipoprotein n=1 Tax=Stenotrophomonas maltophilia TaxID=40324 RepID=A0A1A6XQB2_STEMA|nr:hypothetical protein [Stenotrophomonas maltophilia]OBU64809.1 hypothetical protein A9K58_16305 [Stenotrophomonas maltophilia]
MLKSLPTLPHIALIALMTLAISGCSKERIYPVYRENPAPKDALPIVIRVHDAPVDIPTPKVLVSYEIDPLCLPPINNFEGVQYAPKRQSVEFPVKRISESEFTTTVFKDGMEVADYYGRGPCTWTPSFVQASFAIVIDGREIYTAAPAFFPEIGDGVPSTTYVEKALTPLIDGQVPERAHTWSQTLFDRLSMADRQKYFPIEISSRTDGKAP